MDKSMDAYTGFGKQDS